MQCKGKIVGMVTLVEHNTIVKIMLVKGIMFVVQPGVVLEINWNLKSFTTIFCIFELIFRWIIDTLQS